MTTEEIRFEILRIAAIHEPERPVRDLMSLADAAVVWVSSGRFPEDAIADCTESNNHP